VIIDCNKEPIVLGPEGHVLWNRAVAITEDCPAIRKEAYLRLTEILVHYPDIDRIEKYLFEFDKDPRGPSRSQAYLHFLRAKLSQMTSDQWHQQPHQHFDEYMQVITDRIKQKPLYHEATLDLARTCIKYGPHDLSEWGHVIEQNYRIFLNLQWQPPAPLFETYFNSDDPTYETEALKRFHLVLNELLLIIARSASPNKDRQRQP